MPRGPWSSFYSGALKTVYIQFTTDPLGVNRFKFTNFPDDHSMFCVLTKISASSSRVNPDMQLQRLLEFLFLEKQLAKPTENNRFSDKSDSIRYSPEVGCK